MAYKNTDNKKIFRITEGDGFKTRNILEKGEPFFLICPECSAIKENKRWYHDKEVLESEREEHVERLCPGCEAVKNKWYEGLVVVRNQAIFELPGQVMALIENAEDRHREDDPKNRIVEIDKKRDEWRIYTATPFLARQIAEKLERSYGSKAQYKWSKDDRLVKALLQ